MRQKTTKVLALLVALVWVISAPAAALTTEQLHTLLEIIYVDEVPLAVWEETTVEGTIAALGDPYTEYLTAADYQTLLDSMSDPRTVGIGAVVTMEPNGLRVVSVVEGAAAARGSIVSGDRITHVDGAPLRGMTLDQAIALVTGEEGTEVSCTVHRADGQVRTISLVRRAFTVAATQTELVDGHIGWMTCTTFGGETVGHMRDGLTGVGAGADRWVVDLRGNPGGEADVAVQAAGLFAGEGEMVSFRDRSSTFSQGPSTQTRATDAPVILLTDGWSASASELFSAAVRDYGRGIILGQRTRGKGVGQYLFDKNSAPTYFADGSALKVTGFRYYSPAGNTNDQIGLFPHLMVAGEHVPDVAYLLCGRDPAYTGAAAGTVLRLTIGGWQWYVSLPLARSPEYAPAFGALLEALPPDVEVALWSEGGRWLPEDPAQVAGVGYDPRTFSDIGASPYRDEIRSLAAYGVILGGGDGAFCPEGELTRAELCALLAQAMQLTQPTEVCAFADVDAGAWYAQKVEGVARMGLMKGWDGRFAPLDTVDQQQLITVLARLAAKLNLVQEQALSAAQAAEREESAPALAAFAPWARAEVRMLSKIDRTLMGDYSLLYAPVEEIVPTAPATRGQAAALLWCVLEHIGMIDP